MHPAKLTTVLFLYVVFSHVPSVIYVTSLTSKQGWTALYACWCFYLHSIFYSIYMHIYVCIWILFQGSGGGYNCDSTAFSSLEAQTQTVTADKACTSSRQTDELQSLSKVLGVFLNQLVLVNIHVCFVFLFFFFIRKYLDIFRFMFQPCF